MWLLQGTATVQIEENLQQFQTGEQLAGSSMTQLIVTLVDGAILIGALILLVYLVMGAINWITAGGDKGKVEAARNKIVQSVIGFVILVFVYTLYTFLLNVLDLNFGQGGGGAGGGSGGSAEGPSSCNANTVGQYANDGGRGGYCSGDGAARVRCYAPGKGASNQDEVRLNYYHWEPCNCYSGDELPGYTYNCSLPAK